MSTPTHDLEESLQPIPEDRRTTRLSGQFWIWAGANIAPINWVLGALGISMGLGLVDTVTVLVVGNLIGMAVFGLFVLLGQRTGTTGMLLGRSVFGRRGNYVPSVMQAVVVVGWCAVNTWIVLDLVIALISEIGWVDPAASNIGWKVGVAAVIMAVQVGISMAGYKAIAAFERWTVPPTVIVLILMSVVAWTQFDIDWGYAGPDGVALSGTERIVAMSAVMTAIGIGWGLTWLTYAADYSRFVSTAVPRAKLYLVSALGQFIPVIWLGVLGATLATENGSVDPGKLIVENYGSLAIPVLLLVLHGPIATNVLNVYSFGVTAQALDIKLGRRTLNVVVGVFALAATVFFVFQEDAAQTLDAWLVGVVGWVSTWGAIMLVHYYVFERDSRRFDHLFDPVGSTRMPDVNWRALTAFVVGLFGTWMFLNGLVPALQGYGSQALGGLDLSWLVGGLCAAITYYLLARCSHRSHLAAREGVPTSATRAPQPVD